ncbi:MAG: hypothetical protein D6681_17085 [Calditrichaeota bacterium]|nr:MAG: hypothetical protein D6681_17085 [Calditrichota bacterium]
MSAKIEISLIALEVKKWDLETQKITFLSYYVLKDTEKSTTFDVSILQPPEMVEEFLGKMRYECAKMLNEDIGEEEEIEVEFDNETFLRQKLYNYFKRITSELNNPRRKKGQSRMIFTTHMDVYNENQDISFLPRKLQFYVVLNWARKYYEKEDYKRAVEPLRKLIQVDPNYGLGYKWLARSLKKIRKYDEAMRYYERYAEVDGSLDSLLDLAKSYRKGKLFEKSEEVYQRILKEYPNDKEARIGMAQIRYALKNEEYLKILDELYEEDPEWLREWLRDEFNFRIYVPEKTPLSPIQAAKFLGYDKIFDLTQRAFRNEIPSHFNPGKARLTFYKEELENWANAMNRYKCYPEEVKLYPERLNLEEGVAQEITEAEAANHVDQPAQQNARPLTRVEEILIQIRQRKAQRQAEQQANTNSSSDKEKAGSEPSKADETGAKTTRRGRKPKKAASENETPEAAATEQPAIAEEKPKRTRKKKTTTEEPATE